MKPARRVVTRSPHKNVGVVCCPWLQVDPIEFESIMERWFLTVAVLLPRLQRIEHQPFRLELPPREDSTKPTTYVPDFLLTFDSGEQVVIEVKPSAFLKKHHAKLTAAADALRAQEKTFFVITEKNLRSAGPMADAMQIRRIARGEFPDADVARTLAVLADESGYVAAGELSARAGVGRDVVAWLVGRRLVGTKAPRVVDDATLLIHLDKEDCHAALSVGRWFAATPW
ncbi:Tn7 transposase TnsA N-terminal domain-containing protein [Roseateles sp.]|uniref:Tn7 transposase TnsA N-terminal domain-containing protein n=1 Tax=Roseateles sp. TaxID=1971397 RepID=UPI0039EAD148